ncbi:MAG: hypothetical protein QOH57_3016 [Mycobacterium sp.]|nr:hypothetical protein [Mycobacterium sp.]
MGAAYQCADAETDHADADSYHADGDDVADVDDFADGNDNQRLADKRNSDIPDEHAVEPADEPCDHHRARTPGRAAVSRAWPWPVDPALALTGTVSDPRYTGVP